MTDYDDDQIAMENDFEIEEVAGNVSDRDGNPEDENEFTYDAMDEIVINTNTKDYSVYKTKDK